MHKDQHNFSVKKIQIPTFEDDRGILNLIETSSILPFSVERIFFIHQTKKNRGGHAHIHSDQFLVMIQGTCEVKIDNGIESNTFLLNKANEGLLIPRLHYLELKNFSADAILLVLANTKYKKEDILQSLTLYKSYLLKLK